jgi:Flp pilus assembly protein TadG
LVRNASSSTGRESGQALVEFVLVLFPLIIFVGGILQLGIGIANWHDANRVANEGARYAATNEWPGCPASEITCTADPPCNATPPSALNQRSLLNFLRCEAHDAGMPGSVTVTICQPEGTGIGQAVTVKLSARVNFLSASKVTSRPVGVGDSGFAGWLGVTIRSEASMRVERPMTKYTAAAGC